MQRRFVPVCLALFVFLAAAPDARADRPEMLAGAQSFIKELTATAIQKLTDPDVPVLEQETRFRDIVRDYVAFKSIARWVLGGRYWRAASDAQRERYLGLFEDLMAATYAHRFQNYAGEEIEIVNTVAINETQALVKTQVNRPGGDEPLKVDWRVRQTDDSFRIIDIMVEGLSMAQTQRSEFSSFLRDNGGDIDALLGDLEGRLAKTRAERIRAQEAAEKS